MESVPLSVCEEAIRLLAAHQSGLFTLTTKRDAYMIHGLEDFFGLCYDGAYVEDGHIIFVGSDCFAYKINIQKKDLSSA